MMSEITSEKCLRCLGHRLKKANHRTGWHATASGDVEPVQIEIGRKDALFGTTVPDFVNSELYVCCDCGFCEFRLGKRYLESLWSS